MKSEDVILVNIHPNKEKIAELAIKREKREKMINQFYEELSEDAPLVSSWEELKEHTSPTHVLEVDLHFCNAWIHENGSEDGTYLSTHTFYESQHKWSTKILQDCGFNVKLASWG